MPGNRIQKTSSNPNEISERRQRTTMALQESPREDLMKEAVSLVRRIEFLCPGHQASAVVGFNQLGWLFVYLGSERMYRFDEHGRLRRAFISGQMFRTEGQALAVLDRQRHPTSSGPGTQQTILHRRDLSPEELDEFRRQTRSDLATGLEGLRTGEITRTHPVSDDSIILDIAQGLQTAIESREFLAPAIVRR